MITKSYEKKNSVRLYINAKLYSLYYTDWKVYLAVLLFVLGNMTLPQLFHLLPQRGITWLLYELYILIVNKVKHSI